MPIKDSTKQMFADSMKELLKTRDLSQVKVKDICCKCGADRHTFYYHFKDKYDLVAWIFTRTMENSMSNSNGFMGLEESIDSLSEIKAEAAFYRKAFMDYSQNALRHYILDYDIELYERMLKESLQVEELPEDIRFSVRYHCHGCLGLSIDWITSNSPLSPRELAQKMTDNMPEILKSVVTSRNL